MPSFPIFSPSGEHVLVLWMNDVVGDYAIQVWRREGVRFVMDWRGWPHPNESASYKLVRWPSENTVELQVKIDFGLPKPQVTKRASLNHTAQGWEVVESP